MRLILRSMGTWLIGLALVLLVIDGTRSLGANGLVLTSLADLWTQMHAQSLASMQDFLHTRFFGNLLEAGLGALLSYPAFAVVGVPGVLLALLGRTPRRERFLREDQV